MNCTQKHIDNKKSILLTNDILEEKGFKNMGKSKFDSFENMNYWIKNGICLFYNVPIKKDYQESFYIGYAKMGQGKYIAVAFRWIDSLEELTQIYESILGKEIEESI